LEAVRGKRRDDRGEFTEAVVDNFEVDAEEAKKDLEEFIEDLTREGLVIKIQEEVKV